MEELSWRLLRFLPRFGRTRSPLQLLCQSKVWQWDTLYAFFTMFRLLRICTILQRVYCIHTLHDSTPSNWGMRKYSTIHAKINIPGYRNGKLLSFDRFLSEIWGFVSNSDTYKANYAPSGNEGIRTLLSSTLTGFTTLRWIFAAVSVPQLTTFSFSKSVGGHLRPWTLKLQPQWTYFASFMWLTWKVMLHPQIFIVPWRNCHQEMGYLLSQ
jgi:hypothetical protein